LDTGFPIHYTGRIEGEDLLRLYYTAADLMVVPSRLDNLPNTAIEAQACGTPVVAFRIGGLPDIIADRETGRLAEPYDPESLAEAMAWVLVDKERALALRVSARQRAERLWSPERIAGMYADMYSEVLAYETAYSKA
jgi:glycosyltransferase involved in cell wall biosynthesis